MTIRNDGSPAAARDTPLAQSPGQRQAGAPAGISARAELFTPIAILRAFPKTMPKTLLLWLLAAALAGCATQGSFVPRQSTITEVRARMGSPTDIRFDENGDELWEYATGPRGSETYLFHFGKDGRVKAITQLLTEDRFAKILPGRTSKAEVRDLLGRPSDQSFLRNGTSWSWRVRVGSRDGRFTVRFGPDNMVVDKNVILERGRDRGARDEGGLLGNTLMQ